MTDPQLFPEPEPELSAGQAWLAEQRRQAAAEAPSSVPAGPGRHRRTDPPTSHDGRERRPQRLQVLEALAAAGEDGLTADELDIALGWPPSRTGRRLPELREAALVDRLVDLTTGELVTRPTRFATDAAVYRITPAGRKALP